MLNYPETARSSTTVPFHLFRKVKEMKALVILTYKRMVRRTPTSCSVRNSLAPIPSSQPYVSLTEPLPTLTQPQASPDWTIDEDFGSLLYQGKPGEVRIPGTIWMYCDAAFAQGFQSGRELLLQHEDGDWYMLTDQEFTALIAQHLPADLPVVASAPWKQGFIFGWCMTWHYQPFLDEEADASGEDESEAASCEGMY
jgi:hypothetical protein